MGHQNGLGAWEQNNDWKKLYIQEPKITTDR